MGIIIQIIQTIIIKIQIIQIIHQNMVNKQC